MGGDETIVVDARGLRCPRPVIELAKAARAAAPGVVLELLATDPAAGPDVAAWCRMRGYQLLAQTSDPADDEHTLPVLRLRVSLGPGDRRPGTCGVIAAPGRTGQQ